ncbi:hypothetical protein F0562_020874 [Nyssa sinensis]|uniref:Uncharacterized protein n=1 Tax=Nyssa sinensis TaxID=561372 RepID=A0A5J5BRR6_9ASTE|nr:hypothetical protein F0562_020874 [Nyssa sinensis]
MMCQPSNDIISVHLHGKSSLKKGVEEQIHTSSRSLDISTMVKVLVRRDRTSIEALSTDQKTRRVQNSSQRQPKLNFH